MDIRILMLLIIAIAGLVIFRSNMKFANFNKDFIIKLIFFILAVEVIFFIDYWLIIDLSENTIVQRRLDLIALGIETLNTSFITIALFFLSSASESENNSSKNNH